MIDIMPAIEGSCDPEKILGCDFLSAGGGGARFIWSIVADRVWPGDPTRKPPGMGVETFLLAVGIEVVISSTPWWWSVGK